MAEVLELGQAIFGNPTGEFGCPRYVDALVEGLLEEIERVYWNRNQTEWDRYEDPQIPGVHFRPYWWGDEDAPEAALPNLKFDGSDQEVRWYKHPGRGSSCAVEWAAAEWAAWFERGMQIIGAADGFDWDAAASRDDAHCAPDAAEDLR